LQATIGRPRLYDAPTCHPDRPHHARGKCLQCYRKEPDVREHERERIRDLRAGFPELTQFEREVRNGADPDQAFARLMTAMTGF
jgi:hypothetical protein